MISLRGRHLGFHAIFHISPLHKFCQNKNVSVSPLLSSVAMAYKRYGGTPAILSPPIVIIHSLFETKVNWRGVAELLEQKLTPPRDVITVDLRNHGQSEYVHEYSYDEMVEDIDKLITDLELMKIVLFGFGIGGMAAMFYATLKPTKVERLIIQDICPFSYIDVEELYCIIRAMRNCRIADNLKFEDAVKKAEECLSHHVHNPMLRTLILQNLTKSSNGRYVWNMNLKDIEANLHRIVNFPMVHTKFRGPTLFLGSTDYHLTQPSMSQRLEAVVPFFPNAHVRVFPNCGHYIHLERTSDFLSVVTQFLNY